MPDGSLQITFRIIPNSTFERKGLDLYVNQNINVLQLIIGTKLNVTTIAGKNLEITIPPGTQNGTKFRLPGQGLTRSGHIGDQYVLINARLPDKISETLLNAIKQEIQ
jgi:DnaJ-class molecular chaperone